VAAPGGVYCVAWKFQLSFWVWTFTCRRGGGKTESDRLRPTATESVTFIEFRVTFWGKIAKVLL
jgi:hypothetical protein